jgi:hypothetical protein
LNASFSMRSVSYQRNVGNNFFPELFVFTYALKIATKYKMNRCDHISNIKCNIILASGRGSPLCCETLRLPHFLDSRLTDDDEVVSLTRWPPFTPQEDSWYSFLLEVESTLGPYWGWKNYVNWKESNDPIGNRIRNLPAFNIVPRQTVLKVIFEDGKQCA